MEWKPFQIDPNVTKTGELLKDYALRRWGSSNPGWLNGMKAKGRQDGANFGNIQWVPNTGKAHQLIHYCKSKGISSTDRLNALLFDAEYERGENISLVDVLVRIGKDASEEDADSENALNVDELRRYLEMDQGYAEVQQEISFGRRKYGIRGVPHFIISAEDDTAGRRSKQRPYGFSGAQAPETFLEIFEELSEE